MLETRQIVAAVQRHWAEETFGVAPTVYPGSRLDLAGAAAWYELWVEASDSRPRRHAAPERLTLSLLIHCFARHATDKRSVQSLADKAREALDGRSMTVRDETLSEPQVTGYVTVQELDFRDLSRNQAALGQEGLQHFVLIGQAVAHELTTP